MARPRSGVDGIARVPRDRVPILRPPGSAARSRFGGCLSRCWASPAGPAEPGGAILRHRDRETADEIKRHFIVVSEQRRSDVRAVAEGLDGLRTCMDRRFAEVGPEIEETRALVRISMQSLIDGSGPSSQKWPPSRRGSNALRGTWKVSE